MKDIIGSIWPEVLIVALIIFLCLACWLKSANTESLEKKQYIMSMVYSDK